MPRQSAPGDEDQPLAAIEAIPSDTEIAAAAPRLVQRDPVADALATASSAWSEHGDRRALRRALAKLLVDLED